MHGNSKIFHSRAPVQNIFGLSLLIYSKPFPVPGMLSSIDRIKKFLCLCLPVQFGPWGSLTMIPEGERRMNSEY